MTTEEKLKKIDDILTRGVSQFVDPDNSFRDKLVAKVKGEYDKDIVIKFGVDPTRPDIHIGHAVALRKLREFQDLGCKVIFLVGDFTSLIGDPTGKSKVRPEISMQEIEHNMKTYLEQVDKILSVDPKVFSWIRNADWFTGVTDIAFEPQATVTLDVETEEGGHAKAKVSANSFIGKATMFEKTRMQLQHSQQVSVISLIIFMATLRRVTHSTLIQRDMFQDRLNSGSELFMHEMMYPIIQGLDSSVLAKVYGSCDLEVGGSDQHFNMLMGRDVMKVNNQDPQAVISFELLEGLDGNEKMSKSLDNYIGITDEPNNMFGKVMSVPDRLIARYFELATYTPLEEVQKIVSDLESGNAHPRDIKVQLAHQLVAIYHGEEAAQGAEDAFNHTFRDGGIPEDIPEFEIAKGTTLTEAVTSVPGLVESKSELRRLVDAGGIKDLESGEKISDYNYAIDQDITLKIGKKRFVRLVAK